MTSQLALDGSEMPIDGLTARQRLALDYIAQHQPVGSDELGAVLHEDRQQRGGRGHHRDERCDYCGSEGRDMLVRLRKLGLVRLQRRTGWWLKDARPGTIDPKETQWPAGF